ncbi:MAG: FadR/GntR family transcriptional regulator [Bacillota bacterium]
MNDNHQRGRVEGVMRQLEMALLNGTYPANTRLPAERDLAQRYGVSRNTVREAIQRLAARGLVRSRPGAGVFVSDQLRTGVSSPWGQLVAKHPAVREDILEFRRVLEGATAYFAALRGNEADIERIRALMAQLDRARKEDDKAGESETDAQLHDAIALASHNSMFLHLHGSIMSMLREHITLNVVGLRELEEGMSEQLLMQHRTICDAICAHRPEEARTAMQAHIDYVRANLTNEAAP